jgi:hypothetical protein
MDYCQRIGHFDCGRDEWFEIADEQSWTKVGNLIVNYVEPFLLKHDTIEKIIASFENGSVPPETLFGVDKGWRAFNIGYCYLWIGRKDSAIEFLREVVDKYSQRPFDWVQNRKNTVLEALANLNNLPQNR